MRILNILPLFLLRLPYRTRLGILIVSFPVSLGLYRLIFPVSHNGTVLVIPILLAAWLFGFRGTFFSFIINMPGVIIVNTLLVGTIFWPQSLILASLMGISGGLLIGLLISSARYTLDRVETARMKALEAEQQMAIAYEQRLEAIKAEQQMTLAYKHQRHLHRLKDQFILNVNHELRTPLTETYGYLDMLSNHRENLGEATQALFLHKALKSCEELILIVNNVLDAAHASSEVKPPQQNICLLAPLIREVLDQLDPREEYVHDFSLDVPDALIVWADQQYLRQILRNLLSNACKYAPRQTLISVCAAYDSSTPQENAASPQVRITIKDAGPGIPPDEIPLLFEKFVRLKRDLSGTIRGTGLGLYISKQLVEAMGGHIWVESSGRDGEGCCFCFTLPIAG